MQAAASVCDTPQEPVSPTELKEGNPKKRAPWQRPMLMAVLGKALNYFVPKTNYEEHEILQGVLCKSWCVLVTMMLLLFLNWYLSWYVITSDALWQVSLHRNLHWLMESCIGIGTVRMGLPGVSSLCFSLCPLVEVMPRIWKDHHVGKLPLLPYTIMVINGMMWATYGILLNIPAVWCPNILGMFLGFCYSAVYYWFCPRQADWLPLTRAVHMAAVVGMGFFLACAICLLERSSSMSLIGLVGSLFQTALFGGPLAAIQTVLKEGSTRSLPFGFTCASVINCSLALIYGLMLGDPMMYGAYLLGMPLAFVQLALFARFGVQS